MAARTKVTKWTVDQIIDLGLEVIGETVEHMKCVPLDDRDGEFAKSMTAFSRAACEISKELRESAAFLDAKKLKPEDITAVLVEHLRTLTKDELSSLFAVVQAPVAQQPESQAHA
jgi:hypothetical protein